ncbi:SDR family oxidoreductase [Saccharibacillus sp. CPCC 101409]|uniref:SDR family oxidoreductase n=1 Tax=Saccharibacillus sp. CPCC 101409 TaxID=3058041 RepID=UPI002674108B|nr:SDR family oxidoreductase [Saccharibacillus sp. CPCC 101409]MDO3409805.1 SDR family oxidoreductase [Saccharibacillus sp. CPCC 101409]
MQTWLITGASGGLGSSLTRQLLERGDRVAATVRKPGVLDELQAQYGERLWQARLDLTNPQQIAEVVERAFAELGVIDVFVNNAAYGLYGAVEEASDAQIEHQFQTNVLGSLRAARAVMPFLREQGRGHLVQISSMAGHYSIPGMGLYCASKWAVEGAFEALAKEAAPFGIRATMVEPGGIRTPFITGNAVYGEPLDAYREQEAGQFTRMMRGEVPGMNDEAAFNRIVVGDPHKMARRIIERVDAGDGPLRMALGSDAYATIRAALLERLAALEKQQELAYSTDGDDVMQRV